MFRKNSSPKPKSTIHKQLTRTAWLLAGMGVLWVIGKNADRKLKHDLENFPW